MWNPIRDILARRALERDPGFQALRAAAAGYASATESRFHRSYRKHSGSGDLLILEDRVAMVALSRALYRNMMNLRALIDGATDLIVGRGLPLRALTKAARAPVREFNAWRDRADHRRLRCGMELDRMTCRDWLLVGDVARIYTAKRTVQLIESERIVSPWKQDIGLLGKIRGGIELHEEGYPEYFWIAPYTATGEVSFDPEPVPARNVAFLASWDQISQTRGAPMIQAGYERLAVLADAQLAAGVANAIQAMYALVMKGAKPGVSGKLLAQASGAGLSSGAGEKLQEYWRLPMEPGTVLHAGASDEVKTIQPTQPSTGLAQYESLTMRLAAAALGFPLEPILFDFQKLSFSAGKLLAWFAKHKGDIYRCAYAQHVTLEDYQRFVLWRLLDGDTGWDLSDDGDGLFRVALVEPPDWVVDPSRQAQADRSNLEMNIDTEEDVIRRRGGDPEAVHERRVFEVTRNRAAGIAPLPLPGQDATGAGTPSGGVDPEDDAALAEAGLTRENAQDQ